jgi:hypothetical protein
VTGEEAIRLVARHALIRMVENYLSDDWEMYADIGESDWEAVVETARALVVEPPRTLYDQAYEFLAARAENGGPGS